MSDASFFSGLSKYVGLLGEDKGEGSEGGEISRASRKLLDQKKLAFCSTKEARALLSYERASKMQALPLGHSVFGHGEVVSFAVPHNHAVDLKAALSFAVGRPVQLIVVEGDLINPALFLAYNRDSSTIEAKLAKLRLYENGKSVDAKKRAFNLVDFHPSSGEAAQFLSSLIEHVVALGASDLHLVPYENGSYAQIRVNGDLLKREEPLCELQTHEQIVGRIKVLSALDTTQRLLPQDGTFSIPLASGLARARVSIMPTHFGEKVVLRIHGSAGNLSLGELGLPPLLKEWIDHLCAAQEGTLLCSGSTGSGKTTTIYGILGELLRRNLSVVSVEDPIERLIQGISQTSVNEKQGLTYPIALRALVRQDPDVLLVGEIRDRESAQISFQASLTGHLVLSTVHGRCVTDVLLRLRDLDIDPLTIAQALEIVIAQRLLPKLCPHCKAIDTGSAARFGGTIYKKRGCREREYTGYHGMVMAPEALRFSSELKAMVKSGCYDETLIDAAKRTGNYLPLSVTISASLRSGDISEAQVLDLSDLQY